MRLSPTLLPVAVWCVACTAWLLGGQPLAADEVTLTDGRVLEGEVLPGDDPAIVNFRITAGGMQVIQHIPRSQVVSVKVGISPRQQEREAIVRERKRLGTAGEASAWWTLALRARAMGDSILGRELAVETVLRDRHHADARRMLGHVEQNGIWMRPHEAATARGELLYEGRYVTWEQREAAVAKIAEDRRLLAERRNQRAEERRQRLLAAAAVAAANDTQDPWIDYYGRSIDVPSNYQTRVVYWPVCPAPTPVPYGNSGLSVNLSGGSGSSSWNIRWNTGSTHW